MQYIVLCTRRSEKGSNNQLTEVETNDVIQPSLLRSACLRLRISLATHIFGKTKMVAETAGSSLSQTVTR